MAKSTKKTADDQTTDAAAASATPSPAPEAAAPEHDPALAAMLADEQPAPAPAPAQPETPLAQPALATAVEGAATADPSMPATPPIPVALAGQAATITPQSVLRRPPPPPPDAKYKVVETKKVSWKGQIITFHAGDEIVPIRYGAKAYDSFVAAGVKLQKVAQ